MGSVQFFLGLVIAEQVYPEYRVYQTISSLGVGPTAFIFNSSLLLEGILVLAAAYFLHRAYHRTLVTGLFFIGGIGAMGGALFPEDVYNVHLAISIVSFFAAGLTPFVTVKLQKPPFTYVSIALGSLSFGAAIFLAIPQGISTLGLAFGTVERIVAYPTLLWVVGFGSYLMKGSAGP